jgi:hypothetical protein
MDDDNFKTELLNRLDRIQNLLTYLCQAAKASEVRAQAEIAQRQRTEAEELETLERSLLQEEMQDDYNQAIQKWKAEKC